MNGMRRVAIATAMVLICHRSSIFGTTVPSESLRFQFDVPKHEFAMYEPVPVRLRLKNLSSREIVINMRIPRLDDLLDLRIEGPHVTTRRYGQGVIRDYVRDGSTVLGPGREYIAVISLFFDANANDLAFPSVGQYLLKARLHVANDPPVYLEADSQTITIVEASDGDRKVTDLLGSTNQLIKILTGGAAAYCREQPPIECAEKLRLIIRSYPASAYTPDIALGLAGALNADLVKVASGKGFAVEVYRDFLLCWPGHFLAPNAMAWMIDSLNDSGDRAQAMLLLPQFERKFPGHYMVMDRIRQRVLSENE